MTPKHRFRKALFAFFKEEIMQATGWTGYQEGMSPFSFQTHPFTCDRSGGNKCERESGTGEGEMLVKDGWFQCPCGEFKQHKVTL